MTRYQRRRNRKRRHKRGPAGLALLVIAASLGLVFLTGVGYVISIAAQTPSLDRLKPVPKGTSSIVLANDGSRLGYVQSDQYRTPVKWSEIPTDLRNATVAAEDDNFYEHSGIDYQAVARAVVNNLKKGRTVEGGSTITQQLVRNTLIGQERTFERKIKEAKYAQELESRYNKNQILTRYLNYVSYGTVGGQTAVGCQAAAQTYFSKDCSELNLNESALLAGLPQAPSIYNPLNNPIAAIERRNEVLKRMFKQNYISQYQYQEAIKSPLATKQGSLYTRVNEPYFFDYVQDLLNEHYGVNTVRKGGLVVHTTIDRKLQKLAKQAIDTTLNYPGDPSAAVVTIDPSNGYIRAMASNSNYSRQQFNLAAQGHRQPGSAFKTMALVTAVKRGINPASTSYTSKPLDLDLPGYGKWKVSTYGESYSGSISLTQATLSSDNTVYAQLALDLGPPSIADTAHELGIKSKLEGLPSETLGGLGQGVNATEMADAYATLASGGRQRDPVAIKEVTFPSGKVEQWEAPETKQVISDGVAYEVTKILEKNVQAGTGTSAQTSCPTAGKTGTTDNFNDAWFVGYTPKLSTAVWVGYPDALRQMTAVHGISVAGGTFPAQIFGKYMSQAVAGNCGDFAQPKTPVEWVPFFGKYAKQGAADYYSEQSEEEGKEEKKDKKKDGDSKKSADKSEDKPQEPPTKNHPEAPPSSEPAPVDNGGGTGAVAPQ